MFIIAVQLIILSELYLLCYFILFIVAVLEIFYY